MNFNNIKLIFRREMRDQIRDRRTLFMIAVLPLLFYPLLGFSFYQIAQFLQENGSKVLVVGNVDPADFKDLPALIGPIVNGQSRFSETLFGDERKKADLLKIEVLRLVPGPGGKLVSPLSVAEMRAKVVGGSYQVVVYFSPDFAQQLERYRAAVRQRVAGDWRAGKEPPAMPEAQIISDTHQEQSVVAGSQVTNVVKNWTKEVGDKTLADSNVLVGASNPIEIRQQFVGPDDRIDTSLWSKVLPFVLMIWAVTGAFYPAVDLCAGEKERGTLETLLTSPALRSEIVMGKLATVMVFSMTTAVLNLVSMGITGRVVMSNLGHLPQMANVGPPPLAALGWLVVALVPVSALFSAVCLALAAFARSTKEGQYYLMPVILVTMPLILLPMAPGAELDLGYSLVPVSGIVLLMRSMMEGTFTRLWPYAIPVTLVTLGCCWLAIRWAIDQFSSESVLFREGERWDLSTWAAHLKRDRQPTPTAAMALLCGVLILVIRFFVGSVLPIPRSFFDLFQQTAVCELAGIATPALLMAVLLTSKPRRTLLLPLPLNIRSVLAIPVAALLAVCLHPAAVTLELGIRWLYPFKPAFQQLDDLFTKLLAGAPNIWYLLFMIAVIPAVCEELAFRGFILSGLRHLGHKWRAIVISALFFGAAHSILQQSIAASLVGGIIGYVAVQTGSLWPGVMYHVVHNSLVCILGLVYKGNLTGTRFGWLQMRLADGEYVYQPAAVIVSLVGAMAILYWFSRFPYARSREETFQQSIEQETVHSLAG